MKIMYKGQIYKFNKAKLMNNLFILIGVTATIVVYGLAGAIDRTLGL